MTDTHFDWKQKTKDSNKIKYFAVHQGVRMEYKPDMELLWVGNGPDTMKFKNVSSLKMADQIMSNNINKIMEIA